MLTSLNPRIVEYTRCYKGGGTPPAAPKPPMPSDVIKGVMGEIGNRRRRAVNAGSSLLTTGYVAPGDDKRKTLLGG